MKKKVGHFDGMQLVVPKSKTASGYDNSAFVTESMFYGPYIPCRATKPSKTMQHLEMDERDGFTVSTVRLPDRVDSLQLQTS